jgi:glycosyltransferase involved in cell wall biosynthesis
MRDIVALSIVIPCYNESQSLEKLFEKCRIALNGMDRVEFIYVDNGSVDDSASVFDRLLKRADYSFARVIKIDVNRGYGLGIIKGLLEARGEVLAWTHADLQTDPADVIRAYEKYGQDLITGKVIVKGKRKNRPFLDVFFTAGMSLVSSFLLSTRLSDVNAQPKIFNHRFLTHMSNAPFDFSLDLYVLYLAKQKDYKILPYPVSFEKRISGEAKGGGTFKGKLKLMKRTFRYILQLKKQVKQENP